MAVAAALLAHLTSETGNSGGKRKITVLDLSASIVIRLRLRAHQALEERLIERDRERDRRKMRRRKTGRLTEKERQDEAERNGGPGRKKEIRKSKRVEQEEGRQSESKRTT